DREERREKDQEDRRQVADSEEHDGDGDPGERADRPEELDDRVRRARGRGPPAEEDAGRDADRKRRSVSRGDAQERVPRVPDEKALAGELRQAPRDRGGGGEDVGPRELDGRVPDSDQDRRGESGQQD